MKLLFRIAITSILLGVIIWKMGGLQKVFSLIAGMNVVFLLLILLLLTADRALMTYKWLRLLRVLSIHFPFLQGLKIYCASMIWGMFLPSTIGSDAIRIFSTSRKGHDAKKVIASVIIERFVGFLSALLLGIFSCVIISVHTNLGPKFETVFWIACGTLALGWIIFLMSFSQRLFDIIHDKILKRFRANSIIVKFKQFHSGYKTYQNNKREIIIFFGLTFCEQLFPIVISWLIAKGLGIDVGLLFIAGALPLSLLVSRLPISINGLGVFEAVFTLLMSLAGLSPVQAVAIAFSGRILQTVAWLPWWFSEAVGRGSFKPPRPAVEGS